MSRISNSDTISVKPEKFVVLKYREESGKSPPQNEEVQESPRDVLENLESNILNTPTTEKQKVLSFPLSPKKQNLYLPVDTTKSPHDQYRPEKASVGTNFGDHKVHETPQRNRGVMENLIWCFTWKEKSMDDFADEYHEKNQRFLQKAMKDKERLHQHHHPLSTPHTMKNYRSHPSVTSPLKPHSVPLSKKALSAISDDDWGYSKSESSEEIQRSSDQDKKMPHTTRPPLSRSSRPNKKSPPASYNSMDKAPLSPTREDLTPEGDPTSPVRLFISSRRHEWGSSMHASPDDLLLTRPKHHRRSPSWDIEFDQVGDTDQHRRTPSGDSTGEKDDIALEDQRRFVAPPPPPLPPRFDIEEELKQISHRYPTPPRKKKERKKVKKEKKRKRKRTKLYSSAEKSEAVLVRESRKQHRKANSAREIRNHHVKRKSRKREEQEMRNDCIKELEKEKEIFMALWKEQYQAEQALRDQEMRAEKLSNAKTWVAQKAKDTVWTADMFIANLPTTLGAVGFCWMLMGMIWFQLMMVHNDACSASMPCLSSDMFGCYECDTTDQTYQSALHFHNFCDYVAGLTVAGLFLKCIFAWRIVADELSNPTTASPYGLVLMTFVRLFGGHERFGEIIAVSSAAMHFSLACWFLYISIVKFRTLPDPSWFPNTIGIAHAATQCWMYHPKLGKYLVFLCIIFFLATFLVSLYRVAWNYKISVPVCWMQLSAPSLTLVAVATIAQSTLQDHFTYQQYPPILSHTIHVLFGLSLIAMMSCIHSWCIRLETFVKINHFTPAHIAFCFPLLSHTYAVQVYQNMIYASVLLPIMSPNNSSISSSLGSYFQSSLYMYWMTLLIGGTIMCLLMSMKFLRHLCQWTKHDIYTEYREPPEAHDTVIYQLLQETNLHEVMKQPFVNPAILQVNETGSLVRIRKGTELYERLGPYTRTRQTIPSFGFDPCMTEDDMAREHAVLIDWIVRNDVTHNNNNNVVVVGRHRYGTRSISDGSPPPPSSSWSSSSPSNHHGRSRLMGELEPLQRILDERAPWVV